MQMISMVADVKRTGLAHRREFALAIAKLCGVDGRYELSDMQTVVTKAEYDVAVKCICAWINRGQR